jgi:N-formylglutamate deformylase
VSHQLVSSWPDPIITTAIHAGTIMRPDLLGISVLPPTDRFREEDPFTDSWLDVAGNTVRVEASRFEVDLNRPRGAAVYRQPPDAWGLDLWASVLTDEQVGESLSSYDEFYVQLGAMVDRLLDEHPHVVLIDLHSYNHRREGPDGPDGRVELNPEINVGTASVLPQWRGLVDAYMTGARTATIDGVRPPDVRENVRFLGGELTRWFNQSYGERGCALAIEVKKVYMDEWTGEPFDDVIDHVGRCLEAATHHVRAHLRGLRPPPGDLRSGLDR